MIGCNPVRISSRFLGIPKYTDPELTDIQRLPRPLYSLNRTALKTERKINSTTKITTPVNTTAKFIPKGANQDPFGGVINAAANQMETMIVMKFTKIIKRGLTFIHKKPTIPANNNVPINKKLALSGNCVIS